MSGETQVAADGGFVLTLRKPVKVPGKNGIEEVSELTFRAPRGGDATRNGFPVVWDPADMSKIQIIAEKMTPMLAALAMVPGSAIDDMHPSDWSAAAHEVAVHFFPAQSGLRLT